VGLEKAKTERCREREREREREKDRKEESKRRIERQQKNSRQELVAQGTHTVSREEPSGGVPQLCSTQRRRG
jgi:hypothetical protein